jgi:hypothetical protein
MRGVTPALSARRRPLHRGLEEKCPIHRSTSATIREFPEFKHANRREIAIEAGHVAELLEPILRRKIEDGEFSPKSSATRKVVVVTDADVRRFSH